MGTLKDTHHDYHHYQYNATTFFGKSPISIEYTEGRAEISIREGTKVFVFHYTDLEEYANGLMVILECIKGNERMKNERGGRNS